MWDGRLQRVETIIERQQRMPSEGDDQRFLIGDKTVERGARGPIRWSSRLGRFRHFATVLGLIPYRSLSGWIEACDRCIAARMA